MYDLTVPDIAKVFNVTAETVRRWGRSGKIESVKLPGKKGAFRFSEKSIKDFEDRYYSKAR